MNTRRFSLLRAGTSMLIALLLAFQPTLSGCSKDKKSTEPEEPAPPVETGPADGEVNRDEIGGEELIVLSVWDEGRSVSPEGSFEVTVSREGAQLLVLQDGTGNARGLTISLPGERIESLSFDARSTALALLMMTPGILSVDPAEASARISSIENLEEFQPLVSLLEANLPSRTLGEVVDTQGIREAMEDCVRSWEVQSTRAFESLLPTDYGLAATIVDASDLGNTRVVLSNAAWRFVSVHRRELNTEGTEERVVAVDANELPVLTSMGGATPVGWGSLFTHHVGNPTSAEDLTNFSTEGRIGKVDYWFEGPGFAEGGAQPPGSIPSDWKEPITLSIVWYLMFPLIDLYLGAERLHHQGPQALERAYGIVKNGITLSELAQASSVAELIDASLDVTFRGLVVIADIGAASGTAGLFGISAPVWATVGTMVAVLGAGFALANVLIAVDSWSSVPRFCTVSVNNPSDIVAPAAVGDLAAGAVTATTVQLRLLSIFGGSGLIG
ncbi:MAG: hypothetical protein FJY85_12510 [Deltaproteobacteria bacterium]|nr:hypothetical protein [Deltaproteobacteria bacterium]